MPHVLRLALTHSILGKELRFELPQETLAFRFQRGIVSAIVGSRLVHTCHERYGIGRDSFCRSTDRAFSLVGGVIGSALCAWQTIPCPLGAELRDNGGILGAAFAAEYLAIT